MSLSKILVSAGKYQTEEEKDFGDKRKGWKWPSCYPPPSAKQERDISLSCKKLMSFFPGRFSLSLCLSLCLSLSLSLSLSFSVCLSVCLSLSLVRSFSLCLTLSPFLSHSSSPAHTPLSLCRLLTNNISTNEPRPLNGGQGVLTTIDIRNVSTSFKLSMPSPGRFLWSLFIPLEFDCQAKVRISLVELQGVLITSCHTKTWTELWLGIRLVDLKWHPNRLRRK